jgi:glycosyltransferase involved in cell wall biosynthesis
MSYTNNPKVSVVIPTYNRFDSLINTINSVKNQTYKNLEIIVINDCSSQKEYYNFDWTSIGVTVVHLPQNTKDLLGFPSTGYTINKGIDLLSGDYFTTCDDDDSWLPHKIEMQLEFMEKANCKMSCSEGFIGKGPYDSNKKYRKYNSEAFYSNLKNTYIERANHLWSDGFPDIWTSDFLKIHNCIIACSVIIHKDIINKIGKQLEVKMGGTFIDNKIVHIDYDYWLRALEYTDCVYVKEPCIFYDSGHGSGRLY